MKPSLLQEKSDAGLRQISRRRRRQRIFCVDCGQEQDGGRGSVRGRLGRPGKVASKYKMSSPPGDFPADKLGQKLLRATYEEDLPGVLEVLHEGADINYRGTEGETALIITAMENPTLDMIRLLLENGADKTIRASPDGEFLGKTALEIFRIYLIGNPDYDDGPEIIRLLSDPVAPPGGEPAGGAKKKKKKTAGRRFTRKQCKKFKCAKMGFTQKASCRPYKNCYKTRKTRK
jgi:hypothetical protein